MGKFGITELLIILAIVILLFGTKKLRNMGGDIGGAIRSFRKALKDGEKESSEEGGSSIENKEETTSKHG